MFKSEKITYVSSQAVFLLEDAPNTLGNSVFTSVYQTRDIPLGMIDDLVNGINLSMSRVKYIGKKKFPSGLPTSKLIGLRANHAELSTVIGNEIGKTVTVYESNIGAIDIEKKLQLYLYNDLEFNPFTEEFNSFDPLIGATINSIKATPWEYVNASYIASLQNINSPFTLRGINLVHVGDVTDDQITEKSVRLSNLEDLTTYSYRFNFETSVVEKSISQFHFKINYVVNITFYVQVLYWLNLNKYSDNTSGSFGTNNEGSVTRVIDQGYGDTNENWTHLNSTVYNHYYTRTETRTAINETTVDEETDESTTTRVGTKTVVTANTQIITNTINLVKDSSCSTSNRVEYLLTNSDPDIPNASSLSITNQTSTLGYDSNNDPITTLYEYTSYSDNGEPPTITETTTVNAGHNLHTTSINGLGMTIRKDEVITYTQEITDSVEFKSLDLVDPRKHYIANYSYDDDGVTQYRIWTHPFDVPVAGLSQNNVNFVEDTFYPIVPIRLKNQFLSDYGSADEIKYTKQILKNYGIDLEELESNLGDNPDIADIDRAYIWSGVDISTQSREGKLYVYHFFEKLVEKSIYSKADFDTWYTEFSHYRSNMGGDSGYDIMWVNSTLPSLTKQAVSIVDSLFNIEIEFLYAEKTIITGEYELGIKPKSVKIRTIDSGYTYTNSGILGGLAGAFDFSQELEILYQMPLEADNVPKYVKIIIGGLGHRNTIKDGKAVLTPVSAFNDEEEHNFILPMVEILAKNMNIVERDKLYYESLVMIVNSYERHTVKWYQSAFFRMVIMFVGIVLAQPQLTALGASLAAAASALAVLKIIVPIIFKSVLLNQVMKLAVKVLGEDVALLIAVVAMLMSLGNSKGLLSFELPFADNILLMGSSLMSAVNSSIQKDLADLNKAMTAFSESATEKMDALDEINKELNRALDLDPYVFIGLEPLYITGESSSDYINRSFSVLKAGEISIEVVSKFVDIMLQLPEFKDSVDDTEEPEYEPE